MKVSRTPIIVATLAVTSLGAWLLAGELNPPVGPVAPTMRTNQEIFDAITAGGPGASCAECSLGFPGATRGVGTLSVTGLPGAGGSTVSDIHTFDYKIEFVPTAGGGGGTGGLLTAGAITVTRAIDSSSHRFFQACAVQTEISQAAVRLTTDGTSVYYIYTLNDVRIESVRPTMIRRCDNTYVHAEEIRLSATRVRFTELATNRFWEWNFETGTGTGG